jgi:hypothetical protein
MTPTTPVLPISDIVGLIPIFFNNLGAREGMVKIVAEKKYDEFLGIHLVGPDVTDLVAEGGVALKLESTVEEIARTIHAHPTLPETIMEAAEAVHLFCPRAVLCRLSCPRRARRNPPRKSQ